MMNKLVAPPPPQPNFFSDLSAEAQRAKAEARRAKEGGPRRMINRLQKEP